MKEMKKTHIILILILVSGFSWSFIFTNQSSTNADNEKINWITIQELETLAQSGKWKKEKKKVFVDLYTDWCGWCKKMDAGTFTDPEVIKAMNKHYYAVKFDAESKDTIIFGNQMYKWVPTGRKGINELGSALGAVNGRIGYPTIVFLNDNLEKLQAIPGYKDANTLLPMLLYFGEGHSITTPWDSYLIKYNQEKSNNQFSD